LQLIKYACLDCLNNSSGHGIAQIAKPGNIFLRVLWALFLVVALGGGIFMIYQAFEQYFQYGVITTTKINRELAMTMPAITICHMLRSFDYGIMQYKIEDMFIECYSPTRQNCSEQSLKLYSGLFHQCRGVQLNHVTNLAELIKVDRYVSYIFVFYNPSWYPIHFAVNHNSDRVVLGEVRERVIPGRLTHIVLSKTVQTALGPPHSQCNETQDYRKVTCVEDCINKGMTKACRCVFPEECQYIEKRYECHYHDLKNKIYSDCSLQCPDECNQISFPFNRVDSDWDISSDELNYYKRQISKKFNINRTNDDEIKKRLTRLEIYFNKLETTQITQSPSMTTTNLVGNVGGLLGKIKPFIEWFF